MHAGEIERYLEHLAKLPQQAGGTFVGGPTIELDWGDNVGILTASLAFGDGSRLEVDVVSKGPSQYPEWISHRLHYMDSDRRCIFRYDSAPHHAGVNFPSHKHEGPDERLLDVPTPTIRDIVREIRNRLALHEA